MRLSSEYYMVEGQGRQSCRGKGRQAEEEEGGGEEEGGEAGDYVQVGDWNGKLGSPSSLSSHPVRYTAPLGKGNFSNAANLSSSNSKLRNYIS